MTHIQHKLTTDKPLFLLRAKQSRERFSISNSTFYQRIQDGLITKPLRLGPNSVCWPEHEIDALISAIIAGKNESEIKQLVLELEKNRKQSNQRNSI